MYNPFQWLSYPPMQTHKHWTSCCLCTDLWYRTEMLFHKSYPHSPTALHLSLLHFFSPSTIAMSTCPKLWFWPGTKSDLYRLSICFDWAPLSELIPITCLSLGVVEVVRSRLQLQTICCFELSRTLKTILRWRPIRTRGFNRNWSSWLHQRKMTKG